jgi:hypothetical protein
VSRGRGVPCALLCACLSFASGAWAQDHAASSTRDGEARARELFREGNRLVDEAQYSQALAAFESAYRLWNNPKIQLNIATTLRALGRHSEALGAYRHYLQYAEPSAERRAEVELICVELEEFAKTAADEPKLELDRAERERLRVAVQPPPAPPLPAGAAPSISDVESTRRSSIGVTTRMDIDGRGRGVVGAAGLVYAFDSHWQVSLGGLIGNNQGAWAGVELCLFDGPVRPSVGISAPMFFVDGPRVGASGDIGMRWALSEDTLFVALRAALVHFPEVPEGYVRTVFVPSIGTELRL